MRRLWRWAVVLSCSGCTGVNPAFGSADADGSSTGATSHTSGTTPGTSSASDSTTSAQTDSASGVTTLGPDLGGSATDSGSTGPDAGECWGPDEALVASVRMFIGGQEFTDCDLIEVGGPVAITGDTWTVRDCPSCDDCGGPEFQFQFEHPPPVQPNPTTCATVIGVRNPTTPFGECGFATLVIFDEASPDGIPDYIANAEDLDTPTGVEVEFAVTPELVDGTECPCGDELGAGCCVDPPGLYTLRVNAFDSAPRVAQTDFADGVWQGLPFRFFNLGSHVHRDCTLRRHHDWVLRAQP